MGLAQPDILAKATYSEMSRSGNMKGE